ncbi:MAG: patatin-like phospholipase family protein [Ruminococcaceae bacterium]|nr:patatin-like phospholipase family protein [Oscillospiraceae bacterium]
MPRIGLVLAGGGARGSYQIGVWKLLREIGYEPSVVTGCSVGGLNGAVILQGDYEVACDIWSRISTDLVLDVDLEQMRRKGIEESPAWLAKEAILQGGTDCAPLRQLLEEYLSEETIRSSGIDFGVTMVEWPRMKGKNVFLEEIPRGQLIDYLLASASFFPTMRAYPIGEVSYIDGGYWNNTPVDMALERGAEELVVVELGSPGVVKKIDTGDRPVKYIRSQWDLGHILNFSAETARRNMRLGYLDAKKAFGLADGEKYTFQKDAFKGYGGALPLLYEEFSQLLGIEMTGLAFSTSERYARLVLVRWLFGNLGRKAPLSKLLLRAAEFAGEYMGVSPEECYTVETFSEALKNALEEHQLAVRVAEELRERLILPGDLSREGRSQLREILKPGKGKTVAAILHIMEEYEPKERKKLLRTIAGVVPPETIAACYLWLMRGKKRK